MSSDDGVVDTWRPCTRSHARAIRPSAERASAGKNATPVRAATPSAPSRATMRAPNSATRLPSCSNRIISYSSGPYDASTSPGRTCGDTISPTASGDVPGATCSRSTANTRPDDDALSHSSSSRPSK